MIAAIERQARACAFASRTAFVSEANETLARMISELCGPGYERAFFTSGGSEAIEASFKFARQLAVARGEKSRWKIISRNPAYHGSTLGALAASSDDEADATFGPLMVPMPKIPAPFTYRIPDRNTLESWQIAAADALEETILKEDADTCLAFIIEPVGGLATGALVAADTYYERVREICSRHGVLLIYDEVMSGAGRTGRFLSAHHWPKAMPDLVVLAKGIGAGYTPLGVMMAPADMVDEIAASGGFLHGHTYTANPLTCATGIAVLEEVQQHDMIANAARRGGQLADALEAIKSRTPIVGDVRGKGLLMAIELVEDKKTKRPFAFDVDITRRLRSAAMNEGLILYARRTAYGRFGEWVMIGPPVNATEEHIGEIADRLERALTSCARGLGR